MRIHSAILALWLAFLVLSGCIAQESAQRNIQPQAIAMQACPTQPAVVCIPVTVTPGIAPSATPTQGSIITPSATATASPTALATVTQTPWPTPTPIIRTATATPEPERGSYSPYYGQNVRDGPGVGHSRVGWIGGGSTWRVEVLEYSNGDKWGYIEDRSRGVVGWVAIIHTGIRYGVFTPDR